MVTYQKPWDHVEQVSDELANHPLFKPSLLAMSLKFKTLTYGEISAKLDGMNRCDDLTPEERELKRLLEAEVKKFNDMWNADEKFD